MAVRPLVAFCVLSILWSSAAGAAGILPAPAGMGEGDLVEYRTTRLDHAGARDDPAAWPAFRATLRDASDGRATFEIKASDLRAIHVFHESYDLATREGTTPGRHAVFFVTQADVAAGLAWIGDRPATYVGLTPAGHQFAAGGASYYYDVDTGYLDRVEALDHATVTLRVH